MDFISREQLPLVVFLILPGFISMKVFDLLVPGRQRDAGQQTLEALTYGLLNFGLWYVVLADVVFPMRETNPWAFRGGIVAALVVSPLLLGVLANGLLRWSWMRRWLRHPVPTAWDYYFGRGQSCWVLIRLKSGLLIGGRYSEGSFASSYPDRDLYLEETWVLSEDGKFLQPVRQSEGVLVSMEDCETLEFFTWGAQTAPQNDGQTHDIESAGDESSEDGARRLLEDV